MDINQIIKKNKEVTNKITLLDKKYRDNLKEISRCQIENRKINNDICKLRTQIKVVRMLPERRLYPEEKRDIIKKHPFCKDCKSTENLTVHHKIKLADGGKNIPSNLEVLCINCHRKRHPYDDTAVKNGEYIK